MTTSYGDFGTDGVAIRGQTVAAAHPGKVFWVASSSDATTPGSDGNEGSFDRPFGTIDYAVGQCTASRGDVIMVKSGVSEDIDAAGALDLDVAGITIRGCGNGRNRPTLTFSATASTITVDSANITLDNFYIDVTGIDAVVSALVVGAADFTLSNCEVLMADSGGQCTEFILTDANAHRMKVVNCVMRSPDAGANNAISLVGATDGIEIRNCRIYGDFADAAIHNPTSNVATNLLIENCYLQNDQTGDHALELVSAVTGVIRNTTLVTDAVATAADLGSLRDGGGNWYFDSSDTDAAGSPYPTALGTAAEGVATIGAIEDTTTDSLHGKIGTDTELADSSLFDILVGGAGVPSFPAAAAPANNVSMAEVLRSVYDAVAADGSATTTVNTAYGRRVTKVGDVSGTEDRLFTVTGKCLITMLVGECTSVIATTTSLQLRTSTNDIVLHASTDIVTDVVGTLYMLSGDPDDVLNGGSVPNADVAFIKTGTIAPILMNDDAIDQIVDGAGTGLIEWSLYYIPLEASASIASAA